MLKRWKKIGTKTIHENPWWKYKIDSFQIPNGVAGEYHYVHTEGSSLIIPVKDDGMLILVNQYRYLCDRESLEFPCGGVKSGFSPLEMAVKELQEETGYASEKMERLCEFNPYNGVTTEICTVFAARGLHTKVAKPDATEEFEIINCSPTELDELIRKGRIWDGMTLAAWALTKEKITRDNKL